MKSIQEQIDKLMLEHGITLISEESYNFAVLAYEAGAAAEREWQGLTDEEAAEVERWVEFKEEGSGRIPTGKLIRYIEAKLKEKNT
jgi:hypothetical protein